MATGAERSRVSLATALGLLLCSATATAQQTRGWVIGWFATATANYDDYKNNCVTGRNGGGFELRIRNLMEIGYTKERALEIVNGNIDNTDQDIGNRIAYRASVAGKSASAANYPEAVPDPNIETVTGKYAYGFDLGGTNQDNKFMDPDSGQSVDNQLWRAVGCTESFRATPPEQPYPEELAWATLIDSSPGWSVRVTGQDLSKDGKVTVTLNRLLQHLERDATGKVMWHMTYAIDPSPRSHNVFEGELKNGVITVTPGKRLYLEAEHPFYMDISMRNTHMRLKLEDDGRLTGLWGGYIDWKEFAYMFTSRPANGADYIGIYYAVKKMADASPDPVTGQNREISTAFRMVGTPAYLANAEGKIVAAPAAAKTSPHVAVAVNDSAAPVQR